MAKVIEGKSGKMIVLERGEKIMKTLTELGVKNQWGGGWFTGIGAISNVEIAYYDLEKKKYIPKLFDNGDYELTHFGGDFTLKEGKWMVHAHLVMSDAEFRSFGGHVMEADVAVTAEISFFPFGVNPVRKANPEIGLHLIHST